LKLKNKLELGDVVLRVSEMIKDQTIKQGMRDKLKIIIEVSAPN
jgi:hypothetical protein